MKNMDKLL